MWQYKLHLLEGIFTYRAIRVLEDVKDIAICKLTSADVVRHALVQEIINAYEKADKKNAVPKPANDFKGRYQRKKS